MKNEKLLGNLRHVLSTWRPRTIACLQCTMIIGLKVHNIKKNVNMEMAETITPN